MVRNKSYSDFMNDISSDELYKGLLANGLFTEKLPPIFTSEKFFDYCENKSPSFPKKPAGFIYYESMRNVNIPRSLGIPNPAAYQILCKYLSKIWSQIRKFIELETNGEGHIISRIHLRKMKDSNSLFQMNYSNWKSDGTPVPDLLMGKKYVVHADISNFFPSIYTHALSWALIGKNDAKQNQTRSQWYNELDLYTRNIKNGETHGLLIGPHVSNLLSEIIMIKIDKVLYERGWRYIRNIDDYSCYVSSYEEAQLFLTELSQQLRAYDLTLNYKKTSINSLPKVALEKWVRDIKTASKLHVVKIMDFSGISTFIDMAIELMQDNHDNAAILYYTMKVVAKKRLTKNARSYYIKTIFHLVYIYPYLISQLEKYVFKPFGVKKKMIKDFSNSIYEEGLKLKNYEMVCFAIYYSIKYEFDIKKLDINSAKESNHCLFLLLSYLYYKKRKNKNVIKIYKEHAKTLRKIDSESYWLFIYEVLPQEDLKDYWKAMKKNRVSFIIEV